MSEPNIMFADLELAPAVLTVLGSVGYERPTPVQAACIPPILNGRDVLATAQTGTGKTAAFALPLLSKLDVSLRSVQILVLAPTRELAIQVAEAFETYSQHMKGLKVLPVYGGQGMGDQLSSLRRGVHVVVGTPGRVMDHLRRKTLKLDNLKTVVLDEADEMLRMGFIDDVEWILEQTPKQRQVALFSATMPKQIKKIADSYLQKPERIEIESKTRTVAAIEQVYWSVKGTNKFDAISRILDIEDFDGVVVFVRTKTVTVELADKLEQRGLRASPINGDMSQQLRERTIEKLKQGSIDIVVATDVAARGIDVPRISHVINYDMPFDADVYVHRVGRTGRAGRSGKAILFVTSRERHLLKTIEKHTRQTIASIDLPTRELVTQKRIDRFKAEVVKNLNGKLDPMFKRVVNELIEENDTDLAKISEALVYLAQLSNPLTLPDKKEKSLHADRNQDSRGQKQSGRKNRDDSRKRSRNDGRRNAPQRDRKSKAIVDEFGQTVPSERFKINVGRDHDVSPGDIVGAIANEADISSQYIGHIKINDDHSTVELPEGMPKEVLNHLKKVRIRQQALNIEPADENNKPSTGNNKKPKMRKPRAADKKSRQSKTSGKANTPKKAKVFKKKENQS